jgi:glycosyltransferase involved in cell wall biosynthesis
MSKLSAYVIAYNEALNIRASLESIAWADEIIVVDCFSTDATVPISREFTDKVYQHQFSGFGRLRNEAVAHASYDWILSLDADERVTPELRDEILHMLKQEPEADAYFIARRNHFLGHWNRHCGWYTDYRPPMLFHRKRMRYKDDLVHEGVELDGRVGYLKGHVLHYPYRTLDQFLEKNSRYAMLMAERMVQQGRRFHAHQLITHPVFTFLKMYVLRQGFRDGMPGLILSLLYAYYTFVKYAKLWERCRASA